MPNRTKAGGGGVLFRIRRCFPGAFCNVPVLPEKRLLKTDVFNSFANSRSGIRQFGYDFGRFCFLPWLFDCLAVKRRLSAAGRNAVGGVLSFFSQTSRKGGQPKAGTSDSRSVLLFLREISTASGAAPESRPPCYFSGYQHRPGVGSTKGGPSKAGLPERRFALLFRRAIRSVAGIDRLLPHAFLYSMVEQGIPGGNLKGDNQRFFAFLSGDFSVYPAYVAGKTISAPL